MQFFVGTDDAVKRITKIPGFASADPEEPCQFMNPGLYVFEFDEKSLVQIDDWVNGQNNNPQIRQILPGVIGLEKYDEVIINVPVALTLIPPEWLAGIIPHLEHHTRTYVIDILLAHQKLYNLTEQEILSMAMDE